MKSILIIGMGRFGRHLCKNLSQLGNEVMIVDEKEENLEELLPYVVSAKIGDCTNEAVLRSLGVDNFDLCFVCIGTNFQSSLEITSMVKELGGRYVVSKANRDIHAKFLLRNGADEVIYPDRDIAERLAVRYSANHVFDYIELTDEYSIYEIPPLPEWVGKSIREADIRNRYRISVLGTKVGGKAKVMPGAGYVVQKDEHLMVVGKKEDIDALLKKMP
ncbi:MAG TPA: TrkA family potassium uptake protein [Candidatus Ventrimonas merdavium]|nr:TrkA family potassium uptake protein [Candidatus Ventrimonas merdavium]